MRRKTEYGVHRHIRGVLLCVLLFLMVAAFAVPARADLEYYLDASGNLIGTSETGYVLDGIYYPYPAEGIPPAMPEEIPEQLPPMPDDQPLTAVFTPVAYTPEALAPVLPVGVRLPDVYAGEYYVYDVTAQNSLTGEAVYPAEELSVTITLGFESVERLHAYCLYDESLGYSASGQLLTRPAAVEICPEITVTADNGWLASFSFSTGGGRYVFFSEGSLRQRLESYLACLPDYSSLTPEKAEEVERAVLRIDEMACELTQPGTGYSYLEMLNEMNWARYNHLRYLLNVFKGNVRPMTAEAEDGAMLTVLGQFEDSVRLSICAYPPGDAQRAAAAALLGREPEEMTMYHVGFVSDEELLQPGVIYEMHLELPELYREGGILLLPGGGDGALFSVKSVSADLVLTPPCDFALCR